jgi:amino acid transporter
MSAPPPPPPQSPPPQPGFFRVVAMVLWAFLGIRKRTAAEATHSVVKPQHVIVAGIIGALVFIAILVTLVRFIITR